MNTSARSIVHLSLLLALIPFMASAQSISTPVSASDPYGIDFTKLTGSPTSVTEYRGTSLDALVIHSAVTYEDGDITKMMQYDDDGTARLFTTYSYDKNDRITSIIGSDRNGNQKWKYEYTYNANGNQIEEKSFNASNTLEWCIKSQYTASQKIKKHITYNAADEITLTETFQYNDRGFVSADITQYPDGKLLKRIIYTYTKGGHVAQEDHYDAAGFFERIGYSYTDSGDIISFSNISKDYTVNSRTTLEYGINHKIAKQIIISKDKTKTIITYVYDSNGNWVWKHDGKIFTLRQIEYEEK